MEARMVLSSDVHSKIQTIIGIHPLCISLTSFHKEIFYLFFSRNNFCISFYIILAGQTNHVNESNNVVRIIWRISYCQSANNKTYSQ